MCVDTSELPRFANRDIPVTVSFKIVLVTWAKGGARRHRAALLGDKLIDHAPRLVGDKLRGHGPSLEGDNFFLLPI
jgi:hypothetical protein